MLRTLLVGILAVSAVAACSGKSDPPAAQPGVSAGKVVELTGKVTATRGTDVRTLTEGGEISSDDVIDTAADSRVVILVAHNNARWDLGPNKHGKVADSLAWTAAKVDRPAAAVKEETSTAGRYADKNAATTATTTARNKDESEPDMLPKGGPVPEPTSGQPSPGAPAQPSPPPPPPALERPAAPMPTKAAPRMESAKPRPRATQDTADDVGDSFDEDVSDQKPGGGDRGGGGSLGIKPSDGESPDVALRLEIRKMFVRERPAIAACIEAPTERLIVTITVKTGVFSLTSTDPAATDTTRACLAKIAKRLTSKTKFDAAVTMRMTVVK
jgi:hypothetical protein